MPPVPVPQSITVDYTVTNSFDATTDAPPVEPGVTPIAQDTQIFQVTTDNLGILDPDLGVGGSIGPRCIFNLFVDLGGVVGTPGSGVYLAFELRGTFIRLAQEIDLSGVTRASNEVPLLVPQGYVLLFDQGTDAGPDGFFVRAQIDTPDDPCGLAAQLIIARNSIP